MSMAQLLRSSLGDPVCTINSLRGTVGGLQMKKWIKAATLGAVITIMVPVLTAHADDDDYHPYHHHHHHYHHKMRHIRHDQRDIANDQADIARDSAVKNEQLREGDYGAAAETQAHINRDRHHVYNDYQDLNHDVNN
jgi:hypothetical protein